MVAIYVSNIFHDINFNIFHDESQIIKTFAINYVTNVLTIVIN